MSEISELEGVFEQLWPLNRSLTGDGVRQTHKILGEMIPMNSIEVPSGTQVFDWTVPPEWHIKEAYVIRPDGHRILDVKDNNLHLVNYSMPFCGRLSLAELEPHLHSLPDNPYAIPYVTSYYNPGWGFCLTHEERENLPDGEYEVVVNTDFKSEGGMTLSEAILPGKTQKEVLISTYTCHPSMANNELSGPLLAAYLFKRLAALPERRLTYRFAFLVETIGAIAYLSLRGEHFKKWLVGGLVATCVGLDEPFVYKRSAQGNTLMDRATEQTLLENNLKHRVMNFYPWGSDERQYCSPGFDLPVGCLMRGSFFERPEYHTSLDNRELISFKAILGSVSAYESICLMMERNLTYKNLVAGGEPQLSKYGLYPKIGAKQEVEQERKDLLWLLSLANGCRDLIEISKRSGVPTARLHETAAKCLAAGIMEQTI